MLRIRQVSKSFGTKEALKQISLNLPQGQTHVVVGSSGSGKTTLLRILLGTLSPDKGQIEFDGKVLKAERHRQWALTIGYVPQDGGLFPHLRAIDNVTLVARKLNWTADEIQNRVDDLKSLTALNDSLLRQYPKELSGGQKQRVALMRAAFLNPPIMILDEPLGALDPLIRSELQNELKRIFNSLKKTVVLVTHDIAEAAFFGHTISLLHEGHLLQTGTMGEFIHKPASPFVAQFINAQKSIHEVNFE